MTTEREGCPDHLICFHVEEAAEVAAWIGAMRTWARQAEIACGVKDKESRDEEPDP